MNEESPQKVTRENERMSSVTGTLRTLGEKGVLFFWMQPENSLSWMMVEIMDLLRSGGDQMEVSVPKLSVSGGESKPLRVVTNAAWFRPEVARKHGWSLASRGSWEDWADAIRRHSEEEMITPEDSNSSLQSGAPLKGVPKSPFRRTCMKEFAPPLPPAWGDPSRYHVLFRGKFRRPEHVNVLEGRAGLMAARHMTRVPGEWGRRVLMLTDSRASLGAFSKGRSSARSYISLCRRMSSLRLGTGCSFYWRWVETYRNPADGPSRGSPYPGVYGGP
jgi:hypothetical protein